ncbi:MAG: UDP-N-acetylglucosamine--N-acetylmuramyl-(pentapeptide) pyrophosphoryl-undecaprenol N-acetylglucosamine transferase, partial [Demequinaceae bacterium]|nr:UDP-N-acetylglucosamine--N-acetylmuramyl-(pentapeptide) pyrophosphoryl-undecaprenol N-acetylglucosamine transferase [Demequinaceae bacterium]
LYVPLPVGNGEQSLNAAPAVEAGAATLIEDTHLTAAALTLRLEAMLLDVKKAKAMAVAARKIGIVDGAERLADLVERAVR